MKTVSISIAMATYNGERFIREQLDSLARQTRLPMELVVTDDGSTDRTLEIVEDFAESAPFPVRVYRNERNLGYGDNFLKAASLCEGDWIAFCDQDDVWLNGKLEHIVRILQKSEDPILIMHGRHVVDENLQILDYKIAPFKDAILKPLQGSPWFTPCGLIMVFKAFLVRDFASEVRPPAFDMPSTPMHHDRWIYFLASILGNIIHYGEALVLYRRHSNTVTKFDITGLDDKYTLSDVLKTGADHYSARAKLSEEYARFLDDLASGNAHHNALMAGVGHYQKISKYFDERANIYRNAGLFSKLSVIYSLAGNGAYRYMNYNGNAALPLLKDVAYLSVSELFPRMTKPKPNHK